MTSKSHEVRLRHKKLRKNEEHIKTEIYIHSYAILYLDIFPLDLI